MWMDFSATMIILLYTYLVGMDNSLVLGVRCDALIIDLVSAKVGNRCVLWCWKLECDASMAYYELHVVEPPGSMVQVQIALSTFCRRVCNRYCRMCDDEVP